jgi:hypothetical protein
MLTIDIFRVRSSVWRDPNLWRRSYVNRIMFLRLDPLELDVLQYPFLLWTLFIPPYLSAE